MIGKEHQQKTAGWLRLDLHRAPGTVKTAELIAALHKELDDDICFQKALQLHFIHNSLPYKDQDESFRQKVAQKLFRSPSRAFAVLPDEPFFYEDGCESFVRITENNESHSHRLKKTTI